VLFPPLFLHALFHSHALHPTFLEGKPKHPAPWRNVKSDEKKIHSKQSWSWSWLWSFHFMVDWCHDS
jgi:hypothetical protein